jgi:CubicO group peptidase (beta-lactamase class C family)
VDASHNIDSVNAECQLFGMNTFKLVSAIFCAWVVTAPAFAHDALGRLNAFFQVLSDENRINGNVLIAQSGTITYQRSFGLADAQTGVPNTPDTSFVLASVSKPMTAVAVFQLVEGKRIGLDDRVTRFFPDFPFSDITVRNLLSHTSGLPNTEELFAPAIKAAPEKIVSNADVIPALRALGKVHFAPGQKFEYSNTNYNLLALLVAKVSGLPFERYMAQRVFKPAGMDHAFIQARAYHDRVPGQAAEYQAPLFYSSRLVPVAEAPLLRKWTQNYIGLSGAGNVVGTVTDLLKFDQALYDGKLVSQSSLDAMFTPVRLNDGNTPWMRSGIDEAAYGMGWYIFRNQDNGKVVFHSGGVPGMNTFFLRNLDHRQLVVAMDNAGMPTVAPEMYLIVSGKDFARKKSAALAYAKSLLKSGKDDAAATLSSLRQDSAYALSEQEMNLIGLQLQDDGQPKAALEVLKMNTIIFPQSFNVYDSYAEVLRKQGKKDASIAMYRLSIKLNSRNEGGKQALREMGVEP